MAFYGGAVSAAREFWKRIETLHAVTYFAPESIDAARAAGLRGFWMGYFGFRAAPLGPVGAAVVEAAFANFAPSMVRRSIPDAWAFAEPTELVAVRPAAAAAALRRVIPGVETSAFEVNQTLRAIVDSGSSIGRPLFAANRDVDALDDPVAQLWQHCTTLREQRGDGHVIALASAGIDGCEAHRLLIAAEALPPEIFRDNRGWTISEWDGAAQRLAARGLLDPHGLTREGRRVRNEIEALTDSLAHEPIARFLSDPAIEELIDVLTPVAEAVASSGVLPFPNPMGLPRLDRR